ncbi:MAG: hypothetical protein IPK85_04050 [Gemmatimonadetes bacterium]|nr:hypothetical protein [Gemmatimonadota bacterium]
MARKPKPQAESPVAVLDEPDTRPLQIRANFARGATKAEIAEGIVRAIKKRRLIRPNGTYANVATPMQILRLCHDAVQEFDRLDKEEVL